MTVSSAVIHQPAMPLLQMPNGAQNIGYKRSDAGAAVRQVLDKLDEMPSLTDFEGVDTTGATSSAVGIQAALTAIGALSRSGKIYVPSGDYLIDAEISVPKGVRLVGDGVFSPTEPGVNDYGATFHITHTTGACFLLNKGCGLTGLNFWYPNQVTTATPTVYDYTVKLDLSVDHVQGVDINDCTFYNPYRAIDLGGALAGNIPGNTHLTNLRMAPIREGIHVGYTLVNLFFENITISPEFWVASVGTAVRTTFMIENCVGIAYDQGTGGFFNDVAMFGLHTGLDVSVGSVTFMHWANSGIDGCVNGVRCRGGGTLQGFTYNGGSITGKNPYDSTVQCLGVTVNTTTLVDKMQFNGVYFGPTNGSHAIFIDATGTPVTMWITFSGCFFEMANNGGEAPAFYNIYINNAAAEVDVIGCRFRNDDANIRCIRALNCSEITVTGNRFRGQQWAAVQLDTVDVALLTSNRSNGTVGAISVLGTATNLKNTANLWDK